MSSADTFNLDKATVLSSDKVLRITQPFLKQALVFMYLENKSFETQLEKKKLLSTSNFFFSNSVFYPYEELPTILIKFQIVVCKLFQLWRV